MTEISADRPNRGRKVLLLLAGVSFIAVPACLWLNRLSLGEYAVQRFCSGRDVQCSLELTTLSLDQIKARNIRLAKENVDPASMDSLTIELDWPELFSPRLTFVQAEAPELVVDVRGGQVSVDILQAFQSGASGGEPPTLPPFAISDGHLKILTDAGMVSGVVDSSGTVGREVQSSLVLEPADLQMDGNRLVLEGGQAQFVLSNSDISGKMELALSEAMLQGFAAADIQLSATIEPQGDAEYVANWDIRASRLEHQKLSGADISSQGQLQLRFDGDPSVEAARIQSAETALEAAWLSLSGSRITSPTGTLVLDARETGLAGPLAIAGEQFESDTLLSGTRFLIDGEVSLADRLVTTFDGQFEGAVSLSGAELHAQHRTMIRELVAFPEPVDLHVEYLKSTLSDLLARFDTAIELKAGFSFPDFTFDVRSHRAAAIQSTERTASLSVSPTGEQDWLTLDGEGLALSGDVHLLKPDEQLDLAMSDLAYQHAFSDGTLSFDASQVDLQPVEVAGRTLALDLEETAYSSEPDDQKFHIQGQLRYSGPLFGVDVEALNVSGNFAGLSSGDGWNVRLGAGDCFQYGVGGVQISDIELGTSRGELCAPSGVLVRRNEKTGALSGRLTGEALEFPLTHPAMSGDVMLARPVIDWALTDGFDLTLAGSGLETSLLMGATRVNVGTGSASTALQVQDGATRLALNLGSAEITMSDLPVLIRMADWDAEGLLTDQGPDLDWTADGVKVIDAINPANDALFKPLMTSGRGRLNAQSASYEGPLGLADQDADFGQLVISHDFGSNSGQASLSSGAVELARGELQFHDISEKLRGLAVNASGVARPAAEVSWKDGELDGSGSLSFEDISFSTFRLGRVKNLNGALEISDLMSVRTPPGQRFTVEALELSPAFILQNGEIVLQVLSPEEVQLEKLNWPFVGGQLSIDPAHWSLNGQSQELTVRADKWSLSRLLTLFDIPDVEVEGTVSGQFPVEIIGPDIFLRDAELTAIEDGIIRYKGETGDRAADANEYARMAFDALRNFEYDVLSFGADGNLMNEMVLELALSGHNPDVLDGQLFNLNIRLESQLMELLRGASFAASTQATRDAVKELVRDGRTDTND